MTLSVYINTGIAEGIIVVHGEDIPDAFRQIPIAAADRGLAVVNNGNIVTYKVVVVQET